MTIYELKPQIDKPYNVCIKCPHIGKTCDGPNFLAMTPERWSEWCRLRKNELDMTNAELAELSDVPKSTVDRVLAGHMADVRLSTMRQMTKVLVGGTWGEYPCHMPEDDEEYEQLRDEIERLKFDGAEVRAELADRNTHIARITDQHAKNVAEVRADSQKRVDYLKDRVEFLKRLAIWIGIAAGALLVGLIGVLIFLFVIAL